jgi:AAA15 family ATPase/GTPase
MLKRVSIQNFKSLKDVTLDLQKVNLLIGPNNSGKTNFLKALEFMSIGSQTAYGPADIFKILYANSFKKQRQIGIHIDVYLQGKRLLMGYTMGINRRTNAPYKAVQDVFGNLPNGVSLHEAIPISGFQDFTTEDHLFDNYFSQQKIYKPDPNKLDKPAPVGRGDNSVAADASNLIAFFDRIRDEYPASFAQIKADLTKCVPEFTEINFQNVESTEELVKQFGDKTFKRIGLTDGRQKTIYWADELSEGTLYFLALLCIINQPNPPKLLLLEEPEKGIHPRRIHEVIQFILRLAEEKDVQVIMTTHSPIVVDMFKDMPESVFIFDKDEEGATHVKNLQKDVIEPETEKSKQLGIEPPHYTDSLGDAWTVGFLGGVPK